MFKKIILAAAVSLPLFAGAQDFSAGKIVIGGSTDFGLSNSTVKDADDSTRVFNFEGQAGYLVLNNIEVGAGFAYENSATGDIEASKSSSYTIKPYAAYHMPVSETGSVLLSGNVGFNSRKVANLDATTRTSLGLNAAWEQNIVENVTLATGLTFDHHLESEENLDDSRNEMGVYTSLKVYF